MLTSCSHGMVDSAQAAPKRASVASMTPHWHALGKIRQHNARGIVAVLRSKHTSDAEIRAALTLCFRESGFHRTETTGHCKGLFQLWTHVGRSKWASVRWNTLRARFYVRRRYGSFRAALAHSYRCGWY
jgi:hypothetical protein